MKFRLLDVRRAEYPIRLMCRCLKVSPAGYYAWKTRKPGPRAIANQALLERIRELHELSDGAFGAPRMWEELDFEGVPCGLNRVARLMRRDGLQGIPVRRRRGGYRGKRRPPGIEDLLMRDFKAARKNHKWVTDITEVWTEEGKLYVATVQDLCTKRVPGWSMSSRQTRDLALQAVLMALLQCDDGDEVILHSDQGSQFTSGDYQRLLKRHNVKCSMGAVGTCADNAPAESFFALLKRDRIHRRRYATRAEARRDVFDYIERFHNPRMQRRLIRVARKKAGSTQPSTEMG